MLLRHRAPRLGSNLARYLRELRTILGTRIAWALFLLVGGAATEGVGLLLLVPLLDLIGLDGSLEAVPGGIVGRVVDSARALGLPVTIETILMILLALITTRAVLVRAQATQTAELAQQVTCVLRERLYRAISYSRWIHLVRTRHSDFLQVLTTELARVGAGSHFLIQLLSSSTLLIAYVLAALVLSPRLTLVACALGVLGVVLLMKRLREAHALGVQASGMGKRFFATASEHLSGLKLARSFGAEERSVSRFEVHSRESLQTAVAFARERASAHMWFTISTALMMLTFVFISVVLFRSPSAEILILLVIFTRSAPRMAGIFQSLQQLQHAVPAYDSFLDMVTRCEAEAVPGGEASRAGMTHREEIRLRGVRFRYSRDSDEVLKGIDATLPAGTTTAIVGPSGSGKSTMADLILGLLMPEEGAVLVDGVELTESLAPAWRAGVGYVPQDTFLFNDTIRANLLWARPDAQEEDLWVALDQAAVGDVVRALPNGLQTRVGERGARLSGGERQRLSLARALLLKPTLLILDEATCHLDMTNIEIIQRALDELPRTVSTLVITHRLDTIRHADHVIVLNGGRVTQSGRWEELTLERTAGV